MDKNHNGEDKKPGRPRLEDSELRKYWRTAKDRQKQNREKQTG